MSSKNATMSIPTLLETAKLLPADVSVLVRGDHGIGKSKVVGKQIAKHFGLRIIDFRLGQMTPGDIIGLAELVNGVTRFCPPARIMPAFSEPCLLFFDEVNRGQDEVLQSIFEVALDRTMNGFALHPQTRVYAAGNMSAAYSVNRIDPALLDRFFVADLSASVTDWIAWGRQPKAEDGGSIDPMILDFIAAKGDMLFPAHKCEPDSVQPSPRTWERLNDVLKAAKLIGKPEDPRFYSLSVGFLGVEPATAFVTFAKNVDARVSGQDVLDRYTLEPVSTETRRVDWKNQQGIMEHRDDTIEVGKLQAKCRTLPMDSTLSLIDEIGKIISGWEKAPDEGCEEALKAAKAAKDKTKVKEIEAQLARAKLMGENLGAFYWDLAIEQRVSAWAGMTARGVDMIETVKWFHPYIVEAIVTGGFKVPLGEKGVGVTPDIPMVLQKAS